MNTEQDSLRANITQATEQIDQLTQAKARIEQVAQACRTAGNYPDFYTDEYTAKMEQLDRAIQVYTLNKASAQARLDQLNDPERVELQQQVEQFMGTTLSRAFDKERLQRFVALIKDANVPDEEKRWLISIA